MTRTQLAIVTSASVLVLALGLVVACVIGSGDAALIRFALLGLALVSAGVLGAGLAGFGSLVRRRAIARSRRHRRRAGLCAVSSYS